MTIGEDTSTGDWSEWRRLVLNEIQQLNEEAASLNTRIAQIEKDIARLNVYATLSGAVGGILATLAIQALIGG